MGEAYRCRLGLDLSIMQAQQSEVYGGGPPTGLRRRANKSTF